METLYATDVDFNPPIEMVVIEDKAELAKDYVEHIGLKGKANVAFITDPNTLRGYLGNRAYRVFWIDVHLGLGRESEGIEMTRIARAESPDALIIVFSAYYDTEEACRAAGADHFFQKGRDYDQMIQKIKGIIHAYLEKQTGSSVSTTVFYAEVAHVDEAAGWVKLDCYLEGEEESFERLFPIDRIRAAVSGELIVDLALKITIFEIANYYQVTVEQVPFIPGRDGSAAPDVNLLHSPIWKIV